MPTQDPTAAEKAATARAVAVAIAALRLTVITLADHADAAGLTVGDEAIAANTALLTWTQHLRQQGNQR